jgi:hypothetical protein
VAGEDREVLKAPAGGLSLFSLTKCILFPQLEHFRKSVDRSHRSLRSFPPKKAARNNRQKVHSIAINALMALLRRKVGGFDTRFSD